jgi:hypothetical protein
MIKVNPVEQVGTKRFGYFMPKWLSALWVTDFVETCVFMVNVDDAMWRTVM